MECFGEILRTEWSRWKMTILIDQTTGIRRDSNDLCKTKDDHIELICGNMWGCFINGEKSSFFFLFT